MPFSDQFDPNRYADPVSAYRALRRAEDPRDGHYDPHCFLARHGVYEGGNMPDCHGRLIRAHLIPRKVLRVAGLAQELWWSDPLWVWACGGVTGSSGHHGALDSSRRLRLLRDSIPRSTERFADAHGLTWYLDREYGCRAG
jgi:hypothetical protein